MYDLIIASATAIAEPVGHRTRYGMILFTASGIYALVITFSYRINIDTEGNSSYINRRNRGCLLLENYHWLVGGNGHEENRRVTGNNRAAICDDILGISRYYKLL